MSLYPEDDDKAIDRINEKFLESQIKKTDIDPGLNILHDNPTLEEREAGKKREAVFGLIDDVKAQREDIDKIMSAIPQLIEKINVISGVMDKQTDAINTLIKGGVSSGIPAGAGMDFDKLEVIGGLVDKLADVYTKIKGGSNAAPQLISQELINEKMQKNFMDNLETGEAITDFIKSSLKKNVTKKIINSSLADIGAFENHEPA